MCETERDRGDEGGAILADLVGILQRRPQRLRFSLEHSQDFFVAELSSEKDLDQRGMARALEWKWCSQPTSQFLSPSLSDVVHLASWPIFLRNDLHLGSLPLCQPGQRAVDLALIGRPEVIDRCVEHLFQVLTYEVLTSAQVGLYSIHISKSRERAG
jgi:hypothetical protein